MMNTKNGLSASLRSTFRRTGVLPSLPTSPNEKARVRLWAVALLLTLVRTWGIFLIDELLLTSRLRTPVVSFYLLLAAALFFLAFQRPWTKNLHLNRSMVMRIITNGAMLALSTTLWIGGIRRCRGLRATLLEFADLPLALFFVLNTRRFVLEADITRVRGSVLTMIAVFLLILSLRFTCSLDMSPNFAARNHPSRTICPTILSSITGACMVFGAMLVSFGRIKRSHALAAEMGGMRLLNSLSLVVASIWALPFAIIYNLYDGLYGRYHNHVAPPGMTWPILWNLLLCTICTMLINHLYEPYLLSKGTQVANLKEYRLVTAYFCAVWLCVLRKDHELDLLSFFAFLLFLVGLHLRTSRVLSYFSPSELPQYVDSTTLLLGKWANGPFMQGARKVLRHALARSDSKRMLIFLSISLMFMFVEAIVGLLTNSLGLMSDAGHMLFDNAAIGIGLWASYMSHLPPDDTYSYGHARFEVLAGFINSIFLLFVAITILLEALERFTEPPEVSPNNLLATATAGFLINLSGMLLFHDLAHHNHQHDHAGHDHSHGDDCFAEVMGPKALAKYRAERSKEAHHHHTRTNFTKSFFSLFSNVNLQGIYLHLFADTVGSVSVIISSLLIDYYGLYIADPICSCLVACLVFTSSIPLVRRSASLLLQRSPLEMDDALQDCVAEIKRVRGVVAIRKVHSWQVPVTVVVSLNIRIDKEAACDRHRVLREIQGVLKSFVRPEVLDLTIQLEGPSVWGFIGDRHDEATLTEHEAPEGPPPPRPHRTFSTTTTTEEEIIVFS